MKFLFFFCAIIMKKRAKINLTLDVTGKREDGYHLLETIMQTVALYDGKDEIPILFLCYNNEEKKNFSFPEGGIFMWTFYEKKKQAIHDIVLLLAAVLGCCLFFRYLFRKAPSAWQSAMCRSRSRAVPTGQTAAESR